MAGEPYAVFVAAQHPYQERIDLDEVIDRLSAMEPPVDEELLLTVVKQDHDVVFQRGRLPRRPAYRVVTNSSGDTRSRRPRPVNGPGPGRELPAR